MTERPMARPAVRADGHPRRRERGRIDPTRRFGEAGGRDLLAPGQQHVLARPALDRHRDPYAKARGPRRVEPAVHAAAQLQRPAATARAGNRRFGRLSALRTHTKAPHKTDLHRKTLMALNRPRTAQTEAQGQLMLTSRGVNLSDQQDCDNMHGVKRNVQRADIVMMRC